MADGGRLLKLLRESAGAYLSGEGLSEALGLSRWGLRRSLQELEDAGYKIAQIPARGYRLLEVPDRLLPDEIRLGLPTQTFGQQIACYQETSSTNDRALELAAGGAPEGTLVAAEHQTRGRGRQRRTWVSPAGANLLFSLILRPDWPVAQAPLLTLLAAVAVARSIRRHCHLPAVIKWPNDIYLEDAKIAGILTEMEARGDRIAYLVCGIGINVAAAPEPGSIPGRAGSLTRAGQESCRRLPLLRAVLAEMESLYFDVRQKGFSHLLSMYRPLSVMDGQMVAAGICGGERIEGTALGIDETGALLVRLDSGLTRRIVSGEVCFATPARSAIPGQTL